MKQVVEAYEQGTGKLLDTYEIDVPDRPPTKLEQLEARIAALERG